MTVGIQSQSDGDQGRYCDEDAPRSNAVKGIECRKALIADKNKEYQDRHIPPIERISTGHIFLLTADSYLY